MSTNFPAVPLDIARQKIKQLGQELPDRLSESQTRHVGEDFSRRPFRRHFFDRCLFQECNFDRAVGTGARWSNSEFLGCRFEGADMEFADFSGAVFAPSPNGSRTIILGSGFNATVMRGAQFKDFRVQGSSFAQSDFTHAEFVNCEIMDGTYEGSLFKNTKLTDVSFANANVEFVDFTGAIFKNTQLPLMQFPYVFGLSLDQFENRLVQVSAGRDDKPLSNDELQNIVPALMAYYASNNEYFALANLAMMYGDDEALGQYLSEGIKAAVNLSNFRELKYLCRLAAFAADKKSIITRGILKKFYDTLVTNVNAINDPGLIQQYSLHDGLIRSYLLEGHDDALSIAFTTTTDNAIEAQQSVAQVAKSIQRACACIGVEVTFQQIDVATYSNARARLNVKLPFGIKIQGEWKFGEGAENAKKAPQSPWHSQSIYMAVVVTTGMLFTGANFALNVFDRLDGGDELQKRIDQQVPQILEIREPIKDLIEPGSLTFSEGVMQIAEVRDGELRISNRHDQRLTATNKLLG